MKRIVISLLGGTALTLGTPVIAALILFPRDPDAIGALLLYWPLLLIEKLGFATDCANANSIAEKLGCMRVGLFIDLVCYPLIIAASSYAIYVVLSRRGRKTPVTQLG